MKASPTHTCAALLTFLAASAQTRGGEAEAGATVARELCAAYRQIDSITCSVRKTTSAGGRTVRMLSRVFYKKPNFLHVDIASPAKRRVIADGVKLYYHETGLPRGFSKPIAEVTGPMRASLHNIPGTPMEHLLKLQHAPETLLPPAKEYPVRRAYTTDKLFAVLSCDADMRPVLIEFFKTSRQETKTAEAHYSRYEKAGDGCWIPCLHKTVVYQTDGDQLTETRRVDNLEVNGPIPSHMFNASLFFKDVDFVDEFEKTYAR